MDVRHEFGRVTESAAEKWFLEKFPEFQLIARNKRYRFGELDLVFESTALSRVGVDLVFVEVRARSFGGLVGGVESVGPAKQRRLRNSIEAFLLGYSKRVISLRLDVLAWDGRDWTHVPNVWE